METERHDVKMNEKWGKKSLDKHGEAINQRAQRKLQNENNLGGWGDVQILDRAHG
jgi:hypothetical protein